MKSIIYKDGDSDEPKFPKDFEVIKKAVLQVTDINTNRNKYYAVELHSAKNKYRVFTHYGRTDDLNSNPNAGVKESRYFGSLDAANEAYDKIYKEKTSARKGYKELSLASSKIGSHKSVGQSSGEIDDKTLKKLADKTVTVISKPTISKPVQTLVSELYGYATKALTSTINASITANGIETPLGVLTIGQIDKGQSVLDDLSIAFSKKKIDKDELMQLSGDFYTLIPHKFGRSKDAAIDAIINSKVKIDQKQDTLQLMRDMLNVNGSTNVLINPEIEKKYQALNCKIDLLDDNEFKKISSLVKGSSLKPKKIFSVRREIEHKDFNTNVGNEKLLFHGSGAKNWVGILSRGLLLPKIVTKLGVKRTDAGWLGSGIYFGNEASVAYYYASSGSYGGRTYITIANVALGNIKKYSKITYGLNSPPDGFDSCHGVKGTEFSDNEFVIYNHNQQKLEYLLEI